MTYTTKVKFAEAIITAAIKAAEASENRWRQGVLTHDEKEAEQAEITRAAKIEAYLNRGMITIEDALSGIAEAIREEKQRAREAAETK